MLAALHALELAVEDAARAVAERVLLPRERRVGERLGLVVAIVFRPLGERQQRIRLAEIVAGLGGRLFGGVWGGGCV